VPSIDRATAEAARAQNPSSGFLRVAKRLVSCARIAPLSHIAAASGHTGRERIPKHSRRYRCHGRRASDIPAGVRSAGGTRSAPRSSMSYRCEASAAQRNSRPSSLQVRDEHAQTELVSPFEN
jgi:hypothetical protein